MSSKYGDVLRQLANEIDKESKNPMSTDKNQEIIQFIVDNYIRPLQMSKILKKIIVAEKLGVSASTITQMISSGRINTTTDGNITEYHLWQYITNKN